MTDHSIPDDLARTIASAADDPGRFVDRGETLGVPCEPLHEWQARAVLAALAEWADGGLIDPSTWTVVEATERGVDYCTEHHGVRNEDEGACNFSEWEECEVCAGTGAAEDPEDGDTFDCAECEGSGGFMECVLAPLHTLSPREGEHERCRAGICRRPAGHAGHAADCAPRRLPMSDTPPPELVEIAHERCPAGICRRPAGHAGPHSDLPREGER